MTERLAIPEPYYCGLRMSADEYLAIGETQRRYELVDGVVVLWPSRDVQHQQVLTAVLLEIATFLDAHPLGTVIFSIDVYLGIGPRGGDLVYCPDVVFFRTGRIAANVERITASPDLIVEVVSDASRRYDQETKKADYERFGVLEYWVIDPHRDVMTFYARRDGRFAELKPEGDALRSEAIPGFVLDLARLRKAFELG